MGSVCFLPTLLPAQTAGPNLLMEYHGRIEQDAVALLVREADLQTYLALDDDLILKLRAEGQLAIRPLPSKLAEDLWADRGWGSRPHWILVNTRKEEAGTGEAPPKGGTILAHLGTLGIKPRWEVRDTFLKAHPNHGEAWGEAVQVGFKLAGYRLRALQAKGQVKRQTRKDAPSMLGPQTYVFTSPAPESREQEADRVFEDWAKALEGRRGVANWLDHPMGLGSGIILTFYGAGASPRIRSVCKLMLQDLEGKIRQEPDGPVCYEWPFLSDLAGNPPGLLPQDIIPLPGRAWPSLPFITAGVRSFLAVSDWNGALAFLSASVPPEIPAPMDTEGWEEACSTRAALALGRIMPLLQLGKEGEALEAVEEARRWSGGHWRSGVEDGLAFPFPMNDPRLSDRIRTGLKAPPLGELPAPPALPPYRLTLLGKLTWQEAWGRLHQAEELLPWSPGELAWVTADDTQGQALRARQAWGPEPRWVLIRGAELLASGRTCPTAGALPALLAAQAPSALQRLDAILERQPEHNAARRARLELLKARMPEPRLEPLLVEDERAVWHSDLGKGMPLPFGPEAPWHPDPALWQWAATQALPILQDKLEQWPGSGALWIDWVFWSQFHPAKPSPAALAGTLPIWGPRERWAMVLPIEVHRAVGQALRARGDRKGMVEWYTWAWEAQPRTPATELSQDEWDGYLQKSLKEFGEAVVKPLEEALVALGRSGEARDVERTFRTMTTR